MQIRKSRDQVLNEVLLCDSYILGKPFGWAGTLSILQIRGLPEWSKQPLSLSQPEAWYHQAQVVLLSSALICSYTRSMWYRIMCKVVKREIQRDTKREENIPIHLGIPTLSGSLSPIHELHKCLLSTFSKKWKDPRYIMEIKKSQRSSRRGGNENSGFLCSWHKKQKTGLCVCRENNYTNC